MLDFHLITMLKSVDKPEVKILENKFQNPLKIKSSEGIYVFI
jgi:hypothetical protein